MPLEESVNAIAEGQWKDTESLSSVVIPSTVTHIRSRAFDGCINLKTVVLPRGLEEISAWAFRGCRSLVSVTFAEAGTPGLGTPFIPGGVLRVIGKCAFRDCSNLVSITLPSTLRVIGERAFKNCKRLSDVELPPGLVYLGAASFSGCQSLEVVVLPDAAAGIGIGIGTNANADAGGGAANAHDQEDVHQGVFEGCCNLAVLVSPIGLFDSKTQRCRIYRGCSGKAPARLPARSLVTRVQKPACFKGCNRLEQVSAPDNVVACLSFHPAPPRVLSSAPSTLLELPAAVNEGWAALQLDHYFWCLRLHHTCPPSWRRWVRLALLAGLRAVRNCDLQVPPEMWHYILGFLRLSDCSAALRLI